MKKHVITAIFFLYLLLLFYILLFQDRNVLLTDTGEKVYIYNLVPFREIRRFSTHFDRVGIGSSLLNLLGNIFLFSPLGFLLPMVNHRKDKLYQVTLNAFALSFLIEVVQLVLAIGRFDIDDLILNTFGAILGYLVYRLFILKKGK